jgi:guanylate kinase
MTKDEVINDIKLKKPRIVYISGKTSTGKTTFSKELQTAGYKGIELDNVVTESIVKPFNITPTTEAFMTAYRDTGPKEQVAAFIFAARENILKEITTSSVVVDGAIARSRILKEVFSGELADFYFVYFHPTDVEEYKRRITERFIAGVHTGTTALPKNFWALISDGDVGQFKLTGVLNENLKKAIADFVSGSIEESKQRLFDFKQQFPDIYVVEV